MFIKLVDKIFYFLFGFHQSIKKSLLFILLSIILLFLSLTIKITAEFNFNIFRFIYYPFTLVSDILKSLALHGSIGNLIALILFVLISISPLIIIGLRRKRKKFFDYIFTILICLSIGTTLYLFINPTLIPIHSFIEIKEHKQPASETYYKTIEEAIEGIKNQYQYPYLNESKYDDIESNPLYLQFVEEYHSFYKLSLTGSIGLLLTIYLIYNFYLYTKRNLLNFQQNVLILLTLLKIAYMITFILAFIIFPIMLKSNLIQLNQTKLDYSVLKHLVIIKYLYHYINVLITGLILRKLYYVLENFNNDSVFNLQNVTLLHKTSLYFIILLLCSLVYQLIVNIVQMIHAATLTTTLTTFNFPYFQMILALAFYLLSLYMNQSYKIYKENQLTI